MVVGRLLAASLSSRPGNVLSGEAFPMKWSELWLSHDWTSPDGVA